MNFSNLHVSVQLLSLVVGVLLPLLVGIVTKARASSAVKSVTLVLLSGAAAVATAAVTAGGNFSNKLVLAAGVTWVVGVATHYGLWKPVGASDLLQSATATFGIGPSEPKPVSPLTLSEIIKRTPDNVLQQVLETVGKAPDPQPAVTFNDGTSTGTDPQPEPVPSADQGGV